MTASNSSKLSNNLDDVVADMETDDEERSRNFQNNRNKVFKNPLIVGLLCSHSSLRDLFKLRLVDHIFQEEATKKLRKVHRRISLKSDVRVNQLINCLKKRKDLKLTPPSPFGSFLVDLDQKTKVLKRIALGVSPHAEKYLFETFTLWAQSKTSTEIGHRAAILLSRSPQLFELNVDSILELSLSEKDMRLMPRSFPRLQILGMACHNTRDAPPENTNPFMDFMISRALHLRKLKLPPGLPEQSLRILRSLAINRRNNLPAICYEDQLRVNSDLREFVEEVMNINLPFKSVSVLVRDLAASQEDVKRMARAVSAWLESQSQNLTDLNLEVCLQPDFTNFAFPRLAILKNLKISFPPKSAFVLAHGTEPILPLVNNDRFPAVETLCLERYREDYGLFYGNCEFPTVHQLRQLHYKCTAMNPTWHRTFPNLTSLRVEISALREFHKYFGGLLSYILTHCTQIVHLDLNFPVIELNERRCSSPSFFSRDDEADYWDILTGKAPGYARDFPMSYPDFMRQEEENPPNGVYRVPSLSHMKALKTVHLAPVYRSTMDAIVFMSRASLLVPLQKLSLSGVAIDRRYTEGMTAQEMGNFKNILSEFHGEVILKRS